MKLSKKKFNELYSSATLYNHWSIDSMRYALYEVKKKLDKLKEDNE